MFFYANDMPSRAILRALLEKVSVVIGQRSFTGRALADVVRFMITPNPEVYAEMLLDNFDKGDGTFQLSVEFARGLTQEPRTSATERSRERPTLVILPVLVDFGASFDEPHLCVAELAEQIGFRAVDATPTFRSFDQKAEHFRAASNDLHLKKRTREHNRCRYLDRDH